MLNFDRVLLLTTLRDSLSPLCGDSVVLVVIDIRSCVRRKAGNPYIAHRLGLVLLDHSVLGLGNLHLGILSLDTLYYLCILHCSCTACYSYTDGCSLTTEYCRHWSHFVLVCNFYYLEHLY